MHATRPRDKPSLWKNMTKTHRITNSAARSAVCPWVADMLAQDGLGDLDLVALGSLICFKGIDLFNLRYKRTDRLSDRSDVALHIFKK